MKVKREVTTVEHTRASLTGKDILQLLAGSKRVKITKDTKVFINVPTGADYSGTQLEINADCPIIVSSKTYDRPHPKGESS